MAKIKVLTGKCRLPSHGCFANMPHRHQKDNSKVRCNVAHFSTRLIFLLSVAAGVGAATQGVAGPVENAIRSAESYLSMSGFSRDGLIEQLSSPYGDGYTVSDSTAAVDSLSVDWNAQAVRSAEQYLQMTGFSCNGLIEQLSSDYGSKFTVEQARYGAEQAGAC